MIWARRVLYSSSVNVPLADLPLRQLLADPKSRATLAERSVLAASGRYSWEEIARAHVNLYERLLGDSRGR